ncbi:MAG: tRNA pseudouridine(13) synthase TruD [Planctomycetes bacterium]|nr:tRNA pseudouridine(13) synthase TruD [Planctomycetota bacterium]
MLPLLSTDLPPLLGKVRKQPEDTICHEQLVKEPAGHGHYLWVQVEKSGLSSAQARAALARSVELKAEDFTMAAARDRNAVVLQWMSVKKDLIEHTSALKNAGYKKMLKVRQVLENNCDISLESIRSLKYTLHIRGAAEADGLPRASKITDRLRQQGCANYIGFQRMGPKGQHAKYGRSLLRGKRLPPKVPRDKADCARYIQACQAQLFNRYVAYRIENETFSQVLSGEVVQGQLSQPWFDREVTLSGVDNSAHFQKRLDSWEAVQLGPLCGKDMQCAQLDALVLEEAVLEAAQLPRTAFDRLRGYRRAIRYQPKSLQVSDRKKDIVISCVVDPEVYISSLLEELMHPERHLL